MRRGRRTSTATAKTMRPTRSATPLMSRPFVPRPAVAKKPDRLVYEALPDGRAVANMSIRDIVDLKRKRNARES
jgi:hypothetical protein